MLKQRRPTSSGQRHQMDIDRSNLHDGGPEKSLTLSGYTKRQGRGFKGHITVRHRGGGMKKKIRVMDWKRSKHGIAGTVMRFEYDPLRSAHVALIFYKDGEKAYMLAPEGLNIGDQVMSGPEVEIKTGNALPLKNIPIGMPIHNIELRAGKGAQMVRGAGVSAVVQSKEGNMIAVQLAECFATIGQVGNQEWKNRKIGKAGRKRLMGIRPTVRGTAQHPGSHPHGGGEGRSGIGLKHPKTPWGKHAMGKKTRNRRKSSTALIIKDRRA
jgi:large subunit ribosomal protein L2